MRKFKLEIDITNIEIKNGKLVIELDDDDNTNINRDLNLHPEIKDLDRYVGEYLYGKVIDELVNKINFDIKLKQI